MSFYTRFVYNTAGPHEYELFAQALLTNHNTTYLKLSTISYTYLPKPLLLLLEVR